MTPQRLAAGFAGAVLLAGMSVLGASAAPIERGSVLISDTSGVVWNHDIDSGSLTQLATVTDGNFDIQYTGPRSVLIGNNYGFVSELHLGTLTETVVASGLAGSRGVAVSPRAGGTYYIAEADAGAISRLTPRSSTPELVIDGLVGLENVDVDTRGVIYFTAGTQLGRIHPRQSPATAEVVADFPAIVGSLNGFVVVPDGTAYVATTSDRGVYKVDLNTGGITEAYVGEPPPGAFEDVALALNGDLYVVASDPDNPGLYRIPAGVDSIEPVYVGAPLGDVVDILLTPFTGF